MRRARRPSAWWRRQSVVMLIYPTILTLAVIPAIYVLVKEWRLLRSSGQ